MASIPQTLNLPSSDPVKWRTLLWARLTDPHPSIVAANEQRQSRLVSAVTIGLLVLFAFELVFVPFRANFLPLWVPIALTCVGLAGAYILSRLRYYFVGGAVAVATTALSVLGQVAVLPADVTFSPLASLQWLALPIILGSLLLTARWLVAVSAFSAIGVLFLYWLRPDYLTDDIIGVAISFPIAIAFVMVVVRYIQDRYLFQPQLEELRQLSRNLQRKNAELESANREIRDFAYIVAHDLRAPLVNITGFVEEARIAIDDLQPAITAGIPQLEGTSLRQAEKATQHDLPEALEYLETSAQRMEILIDEVLKLARIGKHEIQIEPIDLSALTQEIGNTFSHQLHQRGAALTVLPMPIVPADRLLLRQVLSNLLDNAIKYLDDHRPGQITVRAEDNAEEVIVHIQDNGRGIAQEDFRKVFQLFRRARNAEDVKGEGVGLPYVQTIVQRQGGRIWFDSVLGQGSTFSFSIPKHSQEGTS